VEEGQRIHGRRTWEQGREVDEEEGGARAAHPSSLPWRTGWAHAIHPHPLPYPTAGTSTSSGSCPGGCTPHGHAPRLGAHSRACSSQQTSPPHTHRPRAPPSSKSCAGGCAYSWPHARGGHATPAPRPTAPLPPPPQSPWRPAPCTCTMPATGVGLARATARCCRCGACAGCCCRCGARAAVQYVFVLYLAVQYVVLTQQVRVPHLLANVPLASCGMVQTPHGAVGALGGQGHPIPSHPTLNLPPPVSGFQQQAPVWRRCTQAAVHAGGGARRRPQNDMQGCNVEAGSCASAPPTSRAPPLAPLGPGTASRRPRP